MTPGRSESAVSPETPRVDLTWPEAVTLAELLGRFADDDELVIRSAAEKYALYNLGATLVKLVDTLTSEEFDVYRRAMDEYARVSDIGLK